MVVTEESFECPCRVECKDCKDFQKVAEIKDSGLVIFRHQINANKDVYKQTQVLESAVSPTKDVFIFQNTRNVDIPSADFMSNLVTLKINCRRCRKIYERAQKLLKKVPIIGKKFVMGICDHCYQKQFPKSCYECEKIVSKFLATRYEESDSKNALRTWLSKMKHVLRDTTSDELKTAAKSHSESYIDKTTQLDSRSANNLNETDNIILVPEKRGSGYNIPGSLPHIPRHYGTDENNKGRSKSLDKSFRFLDSMRSVQKYHPDQGYVGEVLESARSAQGVSEASERYSIFEEPDGSIKQTRDSNIPTSLLCKSKQGKDKHIRSLQTLGISAGLDPMIAQHTHRARQIYKKEASEAGKPAHQGFRASEPRSIVDEIDKTKDIELIRDSNISKSYLYESKHAKDEFIKGLLYELDKSVQIKDFMIQRPDRRYVPKAVEAVKEEQAAIGYSKVRPLFDEHRAIRLLLNEVPDKTPTEKRITIVPKGRYGTPILKNKQGLRIDHYSFKPIIKKTQVTIGTRLKNQPSTETIISTISQAAQDALGKDSSYFFPMTDRNKLKMFKSTPISSTLIQDIQEKIEEEKLRKEAELLKKKQLAQEKSNLIAEKKRLKARIAEEKEKKIQAEEREKKKRTKKDEIAQNIADAKSSIKAKAIDSKGIIGEDKISLAEKVKIKNDEDYSAIKKYKDKKFEQGGKGTGKENDNLTKQQFKKNKAEQLRKKIIEKDLKETKPYEVKEEKESLKKEKGKQPPKYKNEKELKEIKARQPGDEKNKDDKQVIHKVENRFKLGVNVEQDGIHSKKRDQHEKDIEAKSKTYRSSVNDTSYKDKELTSVKLSKPNDGPLLKQDSKQQSERESDNIDSKRSGKNEQNLKERSNDVKSPQNEKSYKDTEFPPAKPPKSNDAPLVKLDREQQSERKQDSIDSKRSGKTEEELKDRSKEVKSFQNEKTYKDRELPPVKPSKSNDAPLLKVDRKEQSKRATDKPAQFNKTVNDSEKEQAESKKKLLDAENKNAKEINGKINNTVSAGQLILQLVKFKQMIPTPLVINEVRHIDPLAIKDYRKNLLKTKPKRINGVDTDLELEIDSIELEKIQSANQEICDIIVGENIVECTPLLGQQKKEQAVVPSLFQPVFNVNYAPMPITSKEPIQNTPEEPPSARHPLTKMSSSKQAGPELMKGVMRYALSDRTFIDKGWTMLPTEKIVRKMNVYRMRPAQPQFDWFEHNKKKRLMLYDSGEKLAEFDDNGRGIWYYKNGHLALDYYDAEEVNANQRFVVYSSGEPDERGRSRPITVLATFDYLGNGVVFDHTGKIRLKYNQTEGVVLDRGIGPVTHWKWHTLNDPPVLQKVMIDTQMPHKDPTILKLGSSTDKMARKDNDEMLAIEFDNFIKEKSKKLSQNFKPFQIKTKALKINEHFSLRVLDQATVYLIYRDGTTNLKLNIGMVLDHKEIVDTDTADVGDVSNSLERFPARTESLAGLQRSVAYAQRYERTRTERERRLRPLVECASVDRITAAAARPLRPPLGAAPTGSTFKSSTSSSRCNNRNASSCQIYYNARLK